MRDGGGKSKGSSFERTICVALSKWLSHDEREDLLWRSSMSGGRATVARKSGKVLQSQAGDLSAIHPDGHNFTDFFYCELKSYNDLNYQGLLTNSGNLYKFWQSTITEANSYKKQPMLIAKQNRMPIVVFIQSKSLELLCLHAAQCAIAAPRHGLYGFLFDDFLKLAKPL